MSEMRNSWQCSVKLSDKSSIINVTSKLVVLKYHDHLWNLKVFIHSRARFSPALKFTASWAALEATDLFLPRPILNCDNLSQNEILFCTKMLAENKNDVMNINHNLSLFSSNVYVCTCVQVQPAFVLIIHLTGYTSKKIFFIFGRLYCFVD